ncbi:MAG: trypsin-like peptidase domain-containing protein, partial [Myxococcota bacterium]
MKIRTRLSSALTVSALAFGCAPAAPPPPTTATVVGGPDAVAGETRPPIVRVTSSDEAVSSAVADLVEQVAPSVVNITTVSKTRARRGPFGMLIPDGMLPAPRERTGAGSGFIVDAAGYVITNSHVVDDAEKLKVRLWDDRLFEAEIVGEDPLLDLALIKMEGASGLPAATLGFSRNLRVGEHVIAVGNPFGLGSTVTMGIVSAKARTIGAGPYDAFIQTDASINPGNSGGPLFNARGEVVGINTAVRANANGIGFAIPVDDLRDVVEQLRTKGFVERGRLGLTFQPITDELADALGLDRPYGAMVNG